VSFAAGVEVVGVDGDDTLWRCQDGFDEAEVEFAQLLAAYAPADVVDATLAATQRANLGLYGFGVKAWTLDLVEVALALSGGRVTAHELARTLQLGKDLLSAPVEVLPGAREAVTALCATHRVVLVTKGDLVDQQRKLALSGLADCFSHVEIVADKHLGAYAELLRFLEITPEQFLMVGNSEVSDIHPVLELGGWAVHVPYRTTWVLERAETPVLHDRRATVASLLDVRQLLDGEIGPVGRPPR
jgi:putative hydrolase of the HAD superfamily